MYNDSFRKRYGIAPIAISENADHYDTSAHIHGEIELLYLKSGAADIYVSDRSYRVKAGELLFVNPLDVHSIKADRKSAYHQRCICFDLSLVADRMLSSELLSGESLLPEHFCMSDEVTAEIAEYFEKLFSSVQRNSDALLFESVAYVSLIFAVLKEKGLIKKTSKSGKKTSFSRKVQEYLSAHYSERITSEDAAGELFYSQSYFCRIFREVFGVSFLEYLSMYRVSKARELLLKGEMSISEVAEQVGFLELSYFSRRFKHYVGVSPSEYQKSQLSK